MNALIFCLPRLTSAISQARMLPRRLMELCLLLLPLISGVQASETESESAPLDGASAVEALQPVNSDQSIAMVFSNAQDLSPERLRIFFITDDTDASEPQSGASLMMEGVSFYEYPPATSGWKWDRTGTPEVHRANGKLLLILSHPRFQNEFSYFVELTDSNWSVADRWPESGAKSIRPRDLPRMQALENDPSSKASMQPLLDARQASLSVELNGGLSFEGWQSIRNASFKEADARLDTAVIDEADLYFKLQDAATGAEALARPTRAWARDDDRAWQGTTLGVEWQLMMETTESGEVRMTGWLNDDEARYIRAEIGLHRSLDGFTWWDDVAATQTITDPSETYGNHASSRYGLERKQSFYPFAVVDDASRALVIETDPTEPRLFYLEATTRRLTANYVMALSPETLKFPGQSTFRCSLYALPLSKGAGFRGALDRFYERYPDYKNRRVPSSGLWMPFSDISQLPNPDDFGFAFFEKGGALGSDVDFAEANDILTLVYTEPWLYWLPFGANEARTPEKALEKMRRIASQGSGWTRDLAGSGLTGATRKANGEIAMKFMDLPWNQGARMEVNTALDLAPIEPLEINRAQAEWTQMERFLSDPRVDGIYLDSMDAAVLPDFNPRSLQATDYPATYSAEQLKPQIPPFVSQYEFTAALGSHLQSEGKYLMGNFTIVDTPFVNRWIDIPGEETDWFSGGRYHPPTRAKLNYKRAMSGQKPFGFLQSTDFSAFKGAPLRHYFETCLLYGFQPSFFSHNAADDPYWLDHELLERDRHLFKTYLALIRRVSDAGWQALQDVSAASNPAIQIEQFGQPADGIWHIVLQNLSSEPESIELTLHPDLGEALLVQPITGRTKWVRSNDRNHSITLAGEQTLLIDLVPTKALQEEIAFLKDWDSGAGESSRIQANLESILTEMQADLQVDTVLKSQPIIGEPTEWTLTLHNQSAETIEWSLGDESTSVDAGANASLPLVSNESSSVETLQWEVTWPDGTSQTFKRSVETTPIAPIKVIDFESRFLTREAVATLPLTLHNPSEQSRSYTVRWAVDQNSDSKQVQINPKSTRTLNLKIPKAEDTHASVDISIATETQTIWESVSQLVFLGDDASLAIESGVEVVTDSQFGGYTTAPLHDGIASTEDVAWNQGSWASTDTESEHWIEVRFPQPTRIEKVTIHWNKEGGITYTGQSGEVLIPSESETGEWTRLTDWESESGEAVTTIPLPSQVVSQIRVTQSALQGAPARPGIMWVSELEIH